MVQAFGDDLERHARHLLRPPMSLDRLRGGEHARTIASQPAASAAPKEGTTKPVPQKGTWYRVIDIICTGEAARETRWPADRHGCGRWLPSELHGIDRLPPAISEYGGTPRVNRQDELFAAIKNDDLATIESLLAADPALAAFFGHPEVLTLLLGCGADPNVAAANPMRVNALHAAAAHRDGATALVMMRELLAHGGRVDLAKHGGWTPLHQAAKNGPVEMVRLLLEHGADSAARADDGSTPLALASAAGQREIAALLRAAGALA